MLKHKIRHSALTVHHTVKRVVELLLQDEASSGRFLLIAASVALIVMNSPLREPFSNFWMEHFTISFGSWNISETFRHWIDEGLMAIFFLVVGLEVKREFVRGELSTWRAASLPIMAAVGGMVVPALIFAAINAGHSGFPGWGISMTTDTAFAVGVLALLGRKVPNSLKAFLLTLVVIDDVGALTVIAIFYTDSIQITPLIIAAGILGLIFLLQWLRLLRLSIFVGLGVALWVAFHASGVHASLAGALLGLSAPIVSRQRNVTRRAIAVRLERALIPVSTFVVIPLFALANAGVVFSRDAFESTDAMLVGVGIMCGLVLGKFIGVVGATWLMVKLNISQLPENASWRHIIGVGSVAGIGCTLSIFIAELAFESTELIDAAKISIFIASVLSALIGALYLLHTHHKHPHPQEVSPLTDGRNVNL